MDKLTLEPPPVSQKRRRDRCNSPESDVFVKSPDEKKFCKSVDDNVHISALLEDASEVNDIFYENTLDEAQEKLLSGVMRSLEEELGASYMSSLSHRNGSVDFSSLPECRVETCFHEEYSLHSSDVTSTSSEGGLESFELPPLLENASVINQKIITVIETSILGSASVGAKEGAGGNGEPSDRTPERLDLGYLLEASDNELGIAPNPSSESVSHEAELIPVKLHETDFNATDNGIGNQESWSEDWDYNPEILFESANEEIFNQDLFRRILPSLEMLMDPSFRDYTSFEAATPYLEPAGASH